MSKYIYGVDTSKEITPIMVRDAIMECFTQAHKEVLNQMDEYQSWKSDEEREQFRNLEIKLLIRNVFREVDVDFDQPTKEGFFKVLDGLANLASKFRNPEIVKKHYNEIMELVHLLP